MNLGLFKCSYLDRGLLMREFFKQEPDCNKGKERSALTKKGGPGDHGSQWHQSHRAVYFQHSKIVYEYQLCILSQGWRLRRWALPWPRRGSWWSLLPGATQQPTSPTHILLRTAWTRYFYRKKSTVPPVPKIAVSTPRSKLKKIRIDG